MKVFATVLSLVSAAVFAVLCGLLVWRDYGLWVIAVCAAIFLALPLSSFLHELGHMLFGAMCKIKAVPKFSPFGASCCRLIPKTDKNLRARLFFTALGGIIVNLLVGTAIVFISVYTPAPVWLMFLVPSNVYLFVLNLIPVWFNAGKTDGLVCNDLLNNIYCFFKSSSLSLYFCASASSPLPLKSPSGLMRARRTDLSVTIYSIIQTSERLPLRS